MIVKKNMSVCLIACVVYALCRCVGLCWCAYVGPRSMSCLCLLGGLSCCVTLVLVFFSLLVCVWFFFFFFFQAEDGIRDLIVTGVQTCALPISGTLPSRASARAACLHARARRLRLGGSSGEQLHRRTPLCQTPRGAHPPCGPEIGRASCRERV